MSFSGSMVSREPNLWKKTINNTLSSPLHMISFNPSPVLSYSISIYKWRLFSRWSSEKSGESPWSHIQETELRFKLPTPLSCPPILSSIWNYSRLALFTGCTSSARNSALQLLFDMGQQRMFCSLDCKHWSDSAFPEFLISQAEACDAKPTSKVHFLLYVLYNMWNVVGICLC